TAAVGLSPKIVVRSPPPAPRGNAEPSSCRLSAARSRLSMLTLTSGFLAGRDDSVFTSALTSTSAFGLADGAGVDGVVLGCVDLSDGAGVDGAVLGCVGDWATAAAVTPNITNTASHRASAFMTHLRPGTAASEVPWTSSK